MIKNKIIDYWKIIVYRLGIIALNIVELVLIFIPNKRITLAPWIQKLEKITKKLIVKK